MIVFLIHSQTGRAHLLLISNTPGKEGGAIGVVTLEGTDKCIDTRFAEAFTISCRYYRGDHL